jgi:hypothetical protein
VTVATELPVPFHGRLFRAAGNGSGVRVGAGQRRRLSSHTMRAYQRLQ